MKRPKQPSPTPTETIHPSQQHKLPEKARRVLDKLPQNDRAVLIESFLAIRIEAEESEEFSGPLPPASMFGEYERVLPGSADRILRMAEKEQDHRIEWETKALSGEMRQERYGQQLGFWVAISCIGGAVYLAMNGQAIIAAILGGSTVLSLAGRFLQRKKDSS